MFSCDGVVMEGNASILVLLGKNLEVGDRILKGTEKQVDPHVEAEGCPHISMCILCFGIFSGDPMSDCFLNKAEVSMEFMLS